jgi:hypothetical protein
MYAQWRLLELIELNIKLQFREVIKGQQMKAQVEVVPPIPAVSRWESNIDLTLPRRICFPLLHWCNKAWSADQK